MQFLAPSDGIMVEKISGNRLMSKNRTIEFYRFLFMLVICVFHIIAQYRGFERFPYLHGGYLGVEFFFMVSGFFLAKQLDDTEKTADVVQQSLGILLRKIKKLYPAFFISFIAYTMWWIYAQQFGTVVNFIDYLFENIYSLLLLNGLGIPNTKAFAGNMWYLSSLVIATYFFVFLALKLKDTFFGFIIPFVCTVCFAYTGYLHGSLSVQELWIGCFYGGVWRGFCELCMGGGYYLITKYIFLPRNIFVNVVCGVLELFSLWGLFRCFNKGFSPEDFKVLIYFGILIFCTHKQRGLMHFVCSLKIANPFVWLGQITYEMYLIHLIFTSLLTMRFPNRSLKLILPLFLTMTILGAWIVNRTSIYIQKCLQKLRK